MAKTSIRRFRFILFAILFLMTAVFCGPVAVRADGMTGDPSAERPTGTATNPGTGVATLDMFDLALLLLVAL